MLPFSLLPFPSSFTSGSDPHQGRMLSQAPLAPSPFPLTDMSPNKSLAHLVCLGISLLRESGLIPGPYPVGQSWPQHRSVASEVMQYPWAIHQLGQWASRCQSSPCPRPTSPKTQTQGIHPSWDPGTTTPSAPWSHSPLGQSQFWDSSHTQR